MKLPTVRFWDCPHNEMVKLSLRPGETKHHSWVVPTEEGYRATFHTWEYVACLNHPVVRETVYAKGRDCDGPWDNYQEFICPIEDLKADFNSHTQLFMPAWVKVVAQQRDYFAEQMRY